MRTLLKMSAAAVALLGLAACGNTMEERALTGAGIGAGAGALGGAAVGAPASGALLGGAAGGATGAFTDEDDIDLGEPIWD